MRKYDVGMDRYSIEPTQTSLYQRRGIYKGWIEYGKLFCRKNLQMGHEKWKYKKRVLHERGEDGLLKK